MSGLRRRLCIFGCDNLVAQGVPLHRFPNHNKQPERFIAWVSAVGEVLKETDPVKIYTNKRICDHHFLPEQKASGHRLVWNAVPSVNLKCVSQKINLLVDVEHSYCLPRRGPAPTSSHIVVPVIPQPSASTSLTCEAIAEPAKHRQNTGVSQTINMSVDVEHNYCLPRTETGSTTSQMEVLFVPETSASTSTTCITIADRVSKNTGATKRLHHERVCTHTKEERKRKNEIRRLRQKNKAIKQRLLYIRRATQNKDFTRLVQHMSEPAKLFTRMQFKESRKKPKGRRYTLEEKVLALSLFKRSPKGYKLMSKMFTLPSKKNLKQLLSHIKLSPGINNLIFKELKETVSKMLPQDRLCSLIFDEMAITPQINYNSNTDDLVGFENLGSQKTNRIADHVLVFMVKGVKANFKQPVAYYFTQNLKTIQLKEILKSVIIQVQATGLNIIATVCDQCQTNVSVINSLIEDAKGVYFRNNKEWRKEVIIVNNQEIFPLYDVPHLLKGVRNNLLNKDMKYNVEGVDKKIKWEYFQRVYEADKTHGELRFLHRLTEEHVNPKKIKKMRVKLAAQVFSRTMAVTTEHMAARGDVPAECRDLIPFVLLIDKLFDTLNSSTFSIPNGKVYKAAVKRNSPHHKLWTDAVKLLKTVKYILKKENSNSYLEKSVPSINNFIKTIENFEWIWKLLHEKHSFDAMLTRNFNQDPLENFFGGIRSLGARNIAPNCVGFEGAFKTLLLNNMNTNHSIHSNCEEDSNPLLQSLLFMLSENENKKNAPSQSQHFVLDQPLNFIENSVNIHDSGADQRAYVCGWALSKCLRNVVKSCKSCRDKITEKPNENIHRFIRAKEYHKHKSWLCYPSARFIACFKDIQNITNSFLKSDCHEKHIKDRIKSLINIFTDFNFMDCNSHKEKLIEYFCDISINIIIYSWCRSVNRILAGKITYDGCDDVTKKAAQEYYLKHKRNQ